MSFTIIIVGGGIAATSCLETLVADYNPRVSTYKSIILISASKLLKRTVNLSLQGRNLETFDVAEVTSDHLSNLTIPDGLKVTFVIGFAQSVNTKEKFITVISEDSSLTHLHYDILSVCIGSSPKLLQVDGSNASMTQERIITIRDTNTVETLKNKLVKSRRVAIIGNGGISLELAHNISKCEKVWIIRDTSIGTPFLDSEASKFLINAANEGLDSGTNQKPSFSCLRSNGQNTHGPALGPDWLQHFSLRGDYDQDCSLNIVYNSQVSRIKIDEASEWPLSLELSNGQKVDCDFAVCAIGVSPNKLDFIGESAETDSVDGGIIIDDQMRSSLSGVYAAGDVASCDRWRCNRLWFQMRLWTQARQMGAYCGRCISSHLAGSDPTIYSNFDCFTHVTRFFGNRVVLLGCYNLQHEQKDRSVDLEILLRIRPRRDYVKLVVEHNRIIGAMLVGDSGLEETIENLIYDRIDIGGIKNSLLDDTIDIDDYFD